MKKIRKLMVLCAALTLMFSFSTVAYAVDLEEIPEATGTTDAKATNDQNPLHTRRNRHCH